MNTNAPRPRRRYLFWLCFLVAAVLMAGAAYAGLTLKREPLKQSVAASEEIISIVGETLRVRPDSPLEKRLKRGVVKAETTSNALLSVTGTVTARLPVGSGAADSRWDFANVEVASAYADWIRADADVQFQERQRQRVNELGEARLVKLAADVSRLEKLVAIGTEAERDLAAARSDRLQAELQNAKDVHEADNAVTMAKRSRGLSERLLRQSGLEPDALRTATPGRAFVVAEVPEARFGEVRVGMACTATFTGLNGQTFTGVTLGVAPVVAKDRRTIRVTFLLNDPEARLLPGLFAEIGLGTEARPILTVPASAVLHFSGKDVILHETERGTIEPIIVQTHEPLTDAGERRVEVAGPIHAGERIVTDGAILLKPLVTKLIP